MGGGNEDCAAQFSWIWLYVMGRLWIFGWMMASLSGGFFRIYVF
jgi:hypothetical protein